MKADGRRCSQLPFVKTHQNVQVVFASLLSSGAMLTGTQRFGIAELFMTQALFLGAGGLFSPRRR
jgi:hypothetical protein